MKETNSEEFDIKLKIPPAKIEGKIVKVKLSEIKSGKIPAVEIKKAIVAFVDVLGFANKTEVKDIENVLLDFSGALAMTSKEFPHIRFNVFSDNAFLATSEDNAKDLIAALRYSFGRWVWNGILVRGGISLGTYIEFSSAAIKAANDNFKGNLFSGTAIVKAVKLESSREGAFLFTDDETAKFFNTKFSEPVFKIKKSLHLGWSDEKYHIFLFVAISLFKLLRIVQAKDSSLDDVQRKFLNNLIYAKRQLGNDVFFTVVVLSILTDISIKQKVRKDACKLMKIDMSIIPSWNKPVKEFREENAQEIEDIRGIVSWDSSIPNWKS